MKLKHFLSITVIFIASASHAQVEIGLGEAQPFVISEESLVEQYRSLFGNSTFAGVLPFQENFYHVKRADLAQADEWIGLALLTRTEAISADTYVVLRPLPYSPQQDFVSATEITRYLTGNRSALNEALSGWHSIWLSESTLPAVRNAYDNYVVPFMTEVEMRDLQRVQVLIRPAIEVVSPTGRTLTSLDPGQANSSYPGVFPPVEMGAGQRPSDLPRLSFALPGGSSSGTLDFGSGRLYTVQQLLTLAMRSNPNRMLSNIDFRVSQSRVFVFGTFTAEELVAALETFVKVDQAQLVPTQETARLILRKEDLIGGNVSTELGRLVGNTITVAEARQIPEFSNVNLGNLTDSDQVTIRLSAILTVFNQNTMFRHHVEVTD